MKLTIESTLTQNVKVITTRFNMPQLNRTRRVWVYLPSGYDGSDKRYPVLYMHDAQNLFDSRTSATGVEWRVDETLAALQHTGDHGAIVIGIDHGVKNRINEFSPWKNPRHGGGDGEKYTKFIVETLKPFVDKHFRTLPDREHTAMMGSSMGGLITLYAGLSHQETFGRLGVFSPSLWFSKEVFPFVEAAKLQHTMKIYMLGSERESAYMRRNLLHLYDSLLKAGFVKDQLSLVIHDDGGHNESFWAREFPEAYLWLFSGPQPSVSPPPTPQPAMKNIDQAISITSSPANEWLDIRVSNSADLLLAEVYDLSGKLRLSKQLSNGQQLNIKSLRPDRYQLRISAGRQRWFKSFVKA